MPGLRPLKILVGKKGGTKTFSLRPTFLFIPFGLA